MPRKGREFELEYKWLFELDKEKYKVTSPAYIFDRFALEKREVDVLVEYKDDSNVLRKVCIECRNRNTIQDVIWIEQLIQKKEDLQLDCIIAASTSRFTKGAINKAKSHGVIIENCNILSRNTFDKIMDECFYFDVFYYKVIVKNLSFVRNNNCLVMYEELIRTMNIIDVTVLHDSVDCLVKANIIPQKVLEECNIDNEVFYSDSNNSINYEYCISISNDYNTVFSKYNIKMIMLSLMIIPTRVSFPLTKSFSTFDENHKNMNYRGIFGDYDNSDYIEIGYIGDNNYLHYNLKKRKYMTCAGGKMSINTIFPKLSESLNVNWNSCLDNMIGDLEYKL